MRKDTMTERPAPKMIRVKVEDAGFTYIFKAGMWSPRKKQKGGT